MKTSIIIPVHNKRDYTEMCLSSIQRNTLPWEYEVVLIDNGSHAPISYADLSEILSGESTIIHNKRNMGFPVAANIGAKVSDGELICFLNNDTVVTPGWLEHMRHYIESDILDVVGPTTNSISGPQQVYMGLYNNDEELEAVAIRTYEENCGVVKRLHRLVGFCMLMKREVWNAAGPFDEVYSPGNFEDDDFCLSAIDHGFRLGYATDVFIHHFGSVSHDSIEDYSSLMRRNQKIFLDKWSKEKIEELIRKNGG